ncbi:MAG: hypothetical protein WC390_07120 [Sulfurimonas sp.]|jgi:hypothetical protein
MENILKIRASQAYKLLTEPRNKADKEAGNLSETTKTYIEELWLEHNYGYKENVMTDEMLKGLLCEQDSMKLVQNKFGGKFRIKNTKNYSNEYITGTPDIILEEEKIVEDIKCSFSVKTFFKAKANEEEINKNYFWQAQCYMALTGATKYRLIYCLVKTPDEIITELKKKLYYKFNCDETNKDYQLWSEQIEINHNLDLIPEEKRIKVFEFDFDQSKINMLYSKIDKARNYYNSLIL